MWASEFLEQPVKQWTQALEDLGKMNNRNWRGRPKNPVKRTLVKMRLKTYYSIFRHVHVSICVQTRLGVDFRGWFGLQYHLS